jgi:hypothetical protein
MNARAIYATSYLALFGLAGCARALPAATGRCAEAPAQEVSVTGDLHIVYGDGPTHHLVWGARSATLRLDGPDAPSADSMLVFARRRVRVAGLAPADTATICVTTIVLDPAGAP